jgi:two-component system sensor histidine kinase/response regulator
VKTILIVDDEPASVALLKELLPHQYQLLGATDGQTALVLAGQYYPDLILLDVMMPDMDGYDVCRALKSNPKTAEIPVIFLTSLTEAEAVATGFTLGAVDYIVKPFNVIELNARVNIHLQLQATKEELARKNAELREQQDLFLEMIPHDLRTSLAIIQGYAELLQRVLRKREVTDETSGSLVGEILQGCDRQKTLINDLVDVGRLKAGLFPLRKSLLPVTTLIVTTLENYRNTHDGITLQVDLPDNLPEVEIDNHSMERVLMNLLANAGKYSAPGSAIFVRAWRQEHNIVVAVCEEGDEITTCDRDKIFGPYYRSSRTNTTEGVGLGLHIAKLVVEAHGGRIWVDRDDKRRNRFCFTVPLRNPGGGLCT